MNYIVSKEVKEVLNKLVELNEIKDLLNYIKTDEDFTIIEQKELTLVEAPTFEEQNRTKVLVEKFKKYGLTDVHIDDHGNVLGYRRGKGNGPTIVIDAHVDTVFPFGSAKEVKEIDGILHCPGICDDTRGLAAILGIARALENNNIYTEGDLLFLATVQEEGMGGLGGMRKFLPDHPEVDGFLCLDGSNAARLVYQATGLRTFEIIFRGIGGHAYNAYGLVANPLNAAARAISKLANLELPTEPKTTMVFSNFHAGTDEAIHAIVDTVSLKVNIRSNDANELDKVYKKIELAVKEAAEEETNFWNKDTITYEFKDIIYSQAGTQPADSPIVQATYACMEEIDIEGRFLHKGGSTNANIPISKGVPAICIGSGGNSGGIHTLAEWYDPKNSYKGVQLATSIALMLAGLHQKSKSVLK